MLFVKVSLSSKPTYRLPTKLTYRYLVSRKSFSTEIRKLWYSPFAFCLPCLVNQVWTFSFIGFVTWFNWKSHHLTMWFQKPSQLASLAIAIIYSWLYFCWGVWTAETERKFEIELLYFDMLFTIRFHV